MTSTHTRFRTAFCCANRDSKKNEIKTIMTICDSWLICEEWHLIDPSQNICQDQNP